MKYTTVIKTIIGSATAIGSLVAANLFAKQQKVDRTAEEVDGLKRRFDSTRLQGETIDINFDDDVAASDQDVDNAI